MRKGEQTRQMIIERAAPVFNVNGFAGTSINDLVRETGLEKGGIYNHFGSKEQLALEAFDYAVSLIRQRFAAGLEGKRHAVDRLLSTVQVFNSVISDPPILGGCPVLNTAAEADDTHPALRERAQGVIQEWQQMIIRIVQKGMERGELKPVEPEAFASIMIATLEGAVMLSKLYGDSVYMQRAVHHLTTTIQALGEKTA